MKTRVWNSLLPLLFFIAGSATLYGQNDSAQVPGDNFSLEGALELFKQSASPEEFEKLLNSSDSKVNNLDLNGDGDIDYIRVIDRNEGNVHAFIMQAVVSQTESQDVAVIELEKQANGKAVLQITGDADIYGTETIIEPTQEVRVNAGTSTAKSVVNVWTWPSVQYVYGPYYTAWSSPWAWSMYPGWWRPWRPVAYYVYNPWWTPYRPYYSVCYSHRIGYAYQLYRPMRTTSVVVYNRHHAQIANYRAANHYSSDGRHGYDRSRSGNNDGYTSSRSDRMKSEYRNSTSGNDSRSGRTSDPMYWNRNHTSWDNNGSNGSRMTDNNSSPSFSHRTPDKSNTTNNNSSFSRGQHGQSSDWRSSRSTSRSFEPGNRTNSQQRLPSFNSGGSRGLSQMNSGGSKMQQGGRTFQQPSNNGGSHHSSGNNGRGRH